MGNLADCLEKAMKAGMIGPGDMDFVSKKATEFLEIMPRRAAEQQALKFMMEDATKELSYVHDQLGVKQAEETEWKDMDGPLPLSKDGNRPIMEEVSEAVQGIPGSFKRGLMSSGLGLGETVNRFAYAPVVKGLAEAIGYVAPDSGAAKFAKQLSEDFYQHTVQIPSEQRKALGEESFKAGAAGEVAHAVGQLAGDLPTILLSGGLLPELQGGIQLVNALRTGAGSMTLPAMRTGADAAEAAKKAGKGEAEQFLAFVEKTGETMLLGAIPMSVESKAATMAGRVASRMGKAAPLAAATVEAQRDIENLVATIRGDETRPFDIVENIKGAIPLALLGGVAGRDTSPGKPTVFEKVHGFREDMLDQVAWMKGKAETEHVEMTPDKVSLWAQEWRSEHMRQEPTKVGAVASPKAVEAVEMGKGMAQRVADFINKPSEWTPFKEGLNLRIAEFQKANDNATRQNQQLKALAPDAQARKGIAMFLEADGDVKQLVAWGAAVKSGEAKDAYKMAGALKPQEQAAAQQIQKRFNTLLGLAQAEGIDVAERMNYVTHLIHNPDADLVTGTTRGVSDYFRFQKHREYDNFFEAFQDGAKPKTLDAVDILTVYETHMMEAINNKRWIEQMKQAPASDGRAIIAPSRVKYTEKGSDYKDMANVPGMDRFVVHPEYYNHIKNVVSRSGIDEWLDARSQNPFLEAGKGITKGLIDAQKYMKGTMFSFSLFHQVTEGGHAIGHQVNPVPKTKVINLNDPAQFDAAAHGLMLRPDRMSQKLYIEGVGADSYNLITKAARKWGGEWGEKAASMLDGYSHYLFESYIPRLKFDTYQAIMRRNSHLFKKDLESGKVKIDQIKDLSADQANAAYGHLNYSKMGHSPTLRQFFQIAVLAPDFLEARARFAGQAAKAFAGSKTGVEQLSALALWGAIQYTGSRILNYLDHGDYEWDMERMFMVKTDLFGLLKAPRWLGLRSVPEDALRFFTDWGQFLRNRLSPLAGLGASTIFKTDWRGEKTDFGQALTDMIAGVVPMPFQGFTNNILQPDRAQGISPWETMLKSTGVQVHRVSPLSEVYHLKEKWMKANLPEQWERDQKSNYPQSQYAALRYALEDGDEELAKAEAKKLGNPARVAKGFKESISTPYTGSLATDQKFYDSLDGHQKEIFKAGHARKALLFQRYRAWVGALPGDPVTEASLMERMRKAAAKKR